MKNLNTTAKGLLIFLAIIFSTTSVQAYSASFTDGFQGGITPSGYTDVVGNFNAFDINHLDYITNNGHNTIQIVGNYFSTASQTRLGTLLGDLFISTNGWNPVGPAPYANDTMHNGEAWELAAVLDNHDFSDTSGTLSLFAVNSNNIIGSYYDGNTNRYRSQQEFRYNGSGAHTTGTWQIIDNTLTLNFDYDFSGSQELGFHWAMSCANDVIEGKVTNSVPEPGTMLLLGFGLVSLVGMGKLTKRD